MSNLECLVMCCLACIVPTVMMGIIVFIVVSLFFFLCKGLEYIYSKKGLVWEFIKSLWMRLIKLIKSYYCKVVHFVRKILEKTKKIVIEVLKKVKIKLIDFKNEIIVRKIYYCKIAVLTFVLLASIVIQILIEFSMFPWTICVNNLNNISIAVVTIQATLFTLVVSLLALVTNNDKIYFGFEVKDFYFNYCTNFLKQKTMMNIGIGLILLNTMLLHFEWYNIVYAIFFISLWLVFESSINVMRIFAGTDDVYKAQIEMYIYECLEKGENVDAIYNNFTNDWKKKIPYQDKSTDELYHRIYCEIYMYIIRNRKNR